MKASLSAFWVWALFDIFGVYLFLWLENDYGSTNALELQVQEHVCTCITYMYMSTCYTCACYIYCLPIFTMETAFCLAARASGVEYC